MIAILFLSLLAFAQESFVIVVVDSRGEPIPNATLRVGDTIVKADSMGRIALEGPFGENDVFVSASDFIGVSDSITNLRRRYKVVLQPLQAEILVEEDAPFEQPFVRSLDKEQVERTPGTHDDPIRLLQSLPGAAQTREYSPQSGAIILRGAQPSESKIFIDGVEIPYLYHFQQYASVIHTRLLNSVDMYPSGYGVSYGNAAGGVVSVNTRRFVEDSLSWSTNANLILAGGFLSKRVHNGQLSLSARRSYADLLDSSNDQYTQWPVFWDYLARYDYSLSDESNVGVTAIGAGDSYGRLALDTELLDPYEQTQNPNFVYERSFHGLLLRHEFINSSFRSQSVLAGIGDFWSGALSDDNQVRNESYAYLRSQNQYIFSDAFLLSFGIESKMGRTYRFANASEDWFVLEREAPIVGLDNAIDETLLDIDFGAWMEGQIKIADRFNIYPGARLQGSLLQSQQRIDPRVTFSYQHDSVQVRVGGGQYSQLPRAESSHPVPIVSRQLAIGVDYNVNEHFLIQTEGWGREVRGRENQEDGWAFGGEVLLSYRQNDRFFSWLSYQHSVSERQELFLQPYALNAVLSWRVRTDIDFGLRYRYSAGMPYIPPVGSTYISSEDRYTPLLDDSASASLPNYQKVDFHLAKHWRWKDLKITGYAELWWVPASSNYLYPVYNFNYSQESLVVGPPILPLLGVRLESQ